MSKHLNASRYKNIKIYKKTYKKYTKNKYVNT